MQSGNIPHPDQSLLCSFYKWQDHGNNMANVVLGGDAFAPHSSCDSPTALVSHDQQKSGLEVFNSNTTHRGFVNNVSHHPEIIFIFNLGAAY